MIKTHVPAITGGLKIRIWDALRVEAQKRGLPVAGFVRRIFQQAMHCSQQPHTHCNCRPHTSQKQKAMPGLLQDQLNKS